MEEKKRWGEGGWEVEITGRLGSSFLGLRHGAISRLILGDGRDIEIQKYGEIECIVIDKH